MLRRQWIEWLEFYNVSPFGAVLFDAWNARHYAQRNNVNRGSKSDPVTKPDDVRIIKDEKPPLTPEKLKRKMLAATCPEALD